MDRTEEYMEVDLLQLVKALWHKAWVIFLFMIAFGGVAFSISSFLIVPMYQSSVLMYVNNSSTAQGSTQLSISKAELEAAQTLVNTYVVILMTRTTLNEVIELAELSYSYQGLREMISAAAVNSTEVFEITVRSKDPKETELIANTITKVLPDRISSIVDGSSVRIVDYAVVPTISYTPKIKKNTAAGMAAGFLIGCMVIVLFTMFDHSIRSEEYLMERYQLPMLSVIPDTHERRLKLKNSDKDSIYHVRRKDSEGKRQKGKKQE